MGHINADRFKKLADAVASDFVTQSIPLNTSIHKLAQSTDMTHEQIRRLCEATNNATFSQVFQAKGKTAEDRIVEFDVADPDKIIGSIIKDAAPVHEKTAALYEYRTLELSSDNIKEAAQEEEIIPEVPFNEIDKRTVRKVAAHLASQKMGWEMAYTDTLHSLDASFKRLYDAPPFESFQKEACQLYGDDVIPEINALRERRKLDPIASVVRTKTASIIDDTSYQFTALTQLRELRQKIAKASITAKKLEKLL